MTAPSAFDSGRGRTRLRLAVMVSIFCSLTMALYVASGVPPSGQILVFVQALPAWTVIVWLVQDARQRRLMAVHDLGFFMSLFWPVLIPWYCFKSRGRRGWLMLMGVVGLVVVPWLTGFAIALIRYAALGGRP